jgi:hypothetical protein
MFTFGAIREAALSQHMQGQVIPVPNTLKSKVGGRFGGIDPAALAKAEAALKGLSNNFAQWMTDELVKLDAARERVRNDGYNAETAESLYFRAHDLKGLGSTYGFPLVTRIAASLCRMIDDPSTRLKAPLALLDAHIDAIKAAVRGDIRDEDHPVGKVLVEELEQKVRQYNG